MDAHARPPEALRRQYKHYQKLSLQALHDDPDLFDLRRPNLAACHERNFFPHHPDHITNLYSTFLADHVNTLPPSVPSARLYEHSHLPGTLPLSHGIRTSFLSPW